MNGRQFANFEEEEFLSTATLKMLILICDPPIKMIQRVGLFAQNEVIAMNGILLERSTNTWALQ